MTEYNQFRVTLSIPWIVQEAQTGQDAINIAVSEAGKRVSESDAPLVHRCDITVQTLSCTSCGTPMEAVLVIAGTALVGLMLECTVSARSPEDAKQMTRRELGAAFDGTPLVPVGTVRTDSRSDVV